jgi:transposase
MNRGSLPGHLPRVEMVVDIDDPACPCCGNALHRIGEDTASGSTSCRRSSVC